MFRYPVVGLLGLVLVLGSVGLAHAECWEGVEEQQEIGFDFVIESEVTGPDGNGVYTYTYILYRIDQGDVTYRDPSHFTIRFACEDEAASALVLGGVDGILIWGEPNAHIDELADDPYGFAEPGLEDGCRANGLKIEFDDDALVPDGDGISYPDDPDDPVLMVQFTSLAAPVEDHWLVKGGRMKRTEMNDGVKFLTDGGTLLVPSCRPPVPVQDTSWGAIKNLYQ